MSKRSVDYLFRAILPQDYKFVKFILLISQIRSKIIHMLDYVGSDLDQICGIEGLTWIHYKLY